MSEELALVQQLPQFSFRRLSSFQKVPSCPFAANLYFYPQLQATSRLLSVSIMLTFPGTFLPWICGMLSFAFSVFHLHTVLEGYHLVTCISTSFLFIWGQCCVAQLCTLCSSIQQLMDSRSFPV